MGTINNANDISPKMLLLVTVVSGPAEALGIGVSMPNL
jgi:hypothetical protein